jgi:two-component system cell cycle response regulator DivK
MSTKLLLVEDNELNRDMLTRRLLRKGFEVITAEDGQEALDQMRKHEPDVVLMDLNLPVLSGWEACKIAANDPDLAHIPMLALTAHALEQELEKALDAGCKDFATKPIDFPVLLEKIAGLITS